jgi:hypothetical protein
MSTEVPNCSEWYPIGWQKLTVQKYGVGVPDGYPAFSPEEAEEVTKKLGMTTIFRENIAHGQERKTWSSKLKFSLEVGAKAPSPTVSKEESDQSIRILSHPCLP